MLTLKNFANPRILLSLPFAVFPKLPVSQVHRCLHLCEGKGMMPKPWRASPSSGENEASDTTVHVAKTQGQNVEESEDTACDNLMSRRCP